MFIYIGLSYAMCKEACTVPMALTLLISISLYSYNINLMFRLIDLYKNNDYVMKYEYIYYVHYYLILVFEKFLKMANKVHLILKVIVELRDNR